MIWYTSKLCGLPLNSSRAVSFVTSSSILWILFLLPFAWSALLSLFALMLFTVLLNSHEGIKIDWSYQNKVCHLAQPYQIFCLVILDARWAVPISVKCMRLEMCFSVWSYGVPQHTCISFFFCGPLMLTGFHSSKIYEPLLTAKYCLMPET